MVIIIMLKQSCWIQLQIVSFSSFLSDMQAGAYIDGLVQEWRNSIANALELRLSSCTNPPI